MPSVDLVEDVLNQSRVTRDQYYNKILNYEQCQIFIVVNILLLSTFVSTFGTISNVINLLVFYKQGLDSSINITFFALAISDLCALLSQQWYNVCMNQLFEKSDVSIVPSEFQYITGALPRVTFSRITCLITVYITMERCLCIIFPLKIKQMVTPRRTTVSMVAIYCFKFAAVAPLYGTASIGWKFYPDRNRSLMGLILASNNDHVTQIVYIMSVFMGLALFAGVVIFTSILIRKLGQKSKWRQLANADQNKSEIMSNRDRKTINMVVLIAITLIMCYTPGVALLAVTFLEREFSILGRFTHLFLAMWSFALLSETINSSVNIFVYLKMSTKYRETFIHLFVCHLKHKTT